MDNIASYIDHALLAPGLGKAQLIEGCELAARLQVATVCVKPSDVGDAASRLAGSTVGVGTVIGFPHGVTTSAVKAAEAKQAIENGAAELDMVVNIGRVLDADWSYVERDIEVVANEARIANGIVKVIFETDLVTEDEAKISLCRICTDLAVDFVKTSTGFGFVKGEDGRYGYLGATEGDIRLMRENSGADVKLKASGGIRSFQQAKAFINMGCERIGTSASQVIVEGAGEDQGSY